MQTACYRRPDKRVERGAVRMTTNLCANCGDEFTQAKPPKAVQVYCSYMCHLEATREIQS